MAYATQADLVTRFGAKELTQLTDRSAAGSPDAAAVSAALMDASGVIDQYLAGRYAVPVSPIPASVSRLACDIARFMLHGKAADDTVRAAYTEAMRQLRDLANGTAVLVGAAGVPAGATPAASPGTVRVSAADRTLDRGNLADYLG